MLRDCCDRIYRKQRWVFCRRSSSGTHNAHRRPGSPWNPHASDWASACWVPVQPSATAQVPSGSCVGPKVAGPATSPSTKYEQRPLRGAFIAEAPIQATTAGALGQMMALAAGATWGALYTPRAGQRRRKHRSTSTSKGGGRSTDHHDLAGRANADSLPETTTSGSCPAISGASPILSLF